MLKTIFTIPNILSLVRIVLTPVFIIMYVNSDYQLIALLLFTLAMLTDTYDGYYARRYAMQTKLGAFLDPIADKVLVLATFSLFAWYGMVHWLAVVLMAVRDIVITSLRLSLIARGTSLQTSALGKGKTVAQFISIYLFFIAHWMEATRVAPVFKKSIIVGANGVIWFVVFFSVYSGIDYIIKYWRFSTGKR